MEFVSAVTEDGDMPIITLFSEAIQPNNLVMMITYIHLPPLFACIATYICIFYSSKYFLYGPNNPKLPRKVKNTEIKMITQGWCNVGIDKSKFI